MATTETPTCSLPADRGPCKGIFYQYAYDARTKSCTQFVYGGCEGNSNRCVSQCVLSVLSMTKLSTQVPMNFARIKL